MTALVVKNFKAAEGKFEALGDYLNSSLETPVLSMDA